MMICNQLSTLLGFECCPLTASGEVAQISTPFHFMDGEGIPVFAELSGGQIRFFDDGGTLLHFIGRGLRLDDKRRTKWISTAAESSGAKLTEDGEIEVWSSITHAPSALAKYIATMMAINTWEREHENTSVDSALFVEEVVMALRARYPDSAIETDPQPIVGISGQTFRFDISFDGQLVTATSPHPNAISANLRKMVDVRGVVSNADVKFLVVIDDRSDPDAADREARVLQAVSKAMPFSSLLGNIGATH